MRKSLNLIAVVSLVFVGCDSSSAPTPPVPKANPKAVDTDKKEDPKENASTKESSPNERVIGGIKFEIPSDWEEKPLASTMIFAEYGLPGDAGPGRLTFSVAGGGTAANIDRWKGQFRRGPDDAEPKESTIRAAGKDATLVEIQGAFSDMFGGGGTKSNWQLLGIAIPVDSDHNYFVKLTGPKETVLKHSEAIRKLVESARFDK